MSDGIHEQFSTKVFVFLSVLLLLVWSGQDMMSHMSMHQNLVILESKSDDSWGVVSFMSIESDHTKLTLSCQSRLAFFFC